MAAEECILSIGSTSFSFFVLFLDRYFNLFIFSFHVLPSRVKSSCWHDGLSSSSTSSLKSFLFLYVSSNISSLSLLFAFFLTSIWSYTWWSYCPSPPFFPVEHVIWLPKSVLTSSIGGHFNVFEKFRWSGRVFNRSSNGLYHFRFVSKSMF